jgi:3-deoxy-D-manno-octulosonic acid kinase
MMVGCVDQIGESMIVYDPALLRQISESLFAPARWPDATVVEGDSRGRGKTLFISFEDQQWVLKHYYRGGFVGRLLNDQYLWRGQSRTRSFREWGLLDQIRQMGLPVPRPVAACCVRRGMVYSADLITQRLPRVMPLAERLALRPLDQTLWRALGEMIGRFHVRHVCHADLSAHNIQIDDQDQLFLLDFDCGRIMPGSGRWSQANLSRLYRSFRKIDRSGEIGFNEDQWQALMAGYTAVHRA